MKKIYIVALIMAVAGLRASAQNDFSASTATAKNEYKAGNLEEAPVTLRLLVDCLSTVIMVIPPSRSPLT